MISEQVEALVKLRYPGADEVKVDTLEVENGVMLTGVFKRDGAIEAFRFVLENAVVPLGAGEPLIPHIVQWFRDSGVAGFDALIDAGRKDGAAMGINGDGITDESDLQVFHLVRRAAFGILTGMFENGAYTRYIETNVQLPDGRVLSFALCRSTDETPATDARTIGAMCRVQGWDPAAESLPDFVARKLEGAK